MKEVKIIKDNIATTSRPDEYKGTIAVDHHTPGTSIEQLINPLINNYLQNDYMFEGMEITIGHPHILLKDKMISLDIILSKALVDQGIKEYIKVERDIAADRLFLACTAISIRLTHRLTFESDKIDWSNFNNPEKG